MKESPDHSGLSSFIQSWLKALKDDKRMIVSAAGRAEKAVRLIMDDEDKAA